MNEYLDKLRETLARRATKCIKLAGEHLSSGNYYLAGSCIASDDTINDIDVYPVGQFPSLTGEDDLILCTTASATTIKNDPPIQFCNYHKDTLTHLIESFDFSHVQAGALIQDGYVQDVAHTDAYIATKLTGIVTFEGTDFPLSSLFRLLKYYKRGVIGRESAGLVISIVSAVVSRGFHDYDDFKRQLDAVDLGLVSEEIDNLSRSDLLSFFEALKK